MNPQVRRATLLALGAIGLWSLLAALAVGLRAVPPFLLLGLSLTGAGLLALPTWRRWRVPPATLLLGLYGLFGFHLLLFLALRRAPAVEANLLNYLWPLLIVVLSPLFERGLRLTARHLAAALLGLAGAALTITGGRWTLASEHWPGYLLAVGAAFAWATYSLGTRRVPPFPTAAVGLFCLVSGVLALGPMGAAFFLWDAALKRGDARAIGALSYLTPLGSTLALVASGQGTVTPPVLVAGALIVGGAVLGNLPAHEAPQPT